MLPNSNCLLSAVPTELLVTEAAHVRMLRVLHELFYQPMADGGYFSQQELQTIFPSLDELIEVHCECGTVALSSFHLPALCFVALPLTPGSLWSSTGEGHTPDPQIPRAHLLGTHHQQAWGGELGGGAVTGPKDPTHPPAARAPTPSTRPALHPISGTLTEHHLSSLLPTALFLDCLMKRRQDSGYLIEEIGDVLLARVREPRPDTAHLPLPLNCPAPPLHCPASPSPRPALSAWLGTWDPGPGSQPYPHPSPRGLGL